MAVARNLAHFVVFDCDAPFNLVVTAFSANALIYGAKRWFLINPEQALCGLTMMIMKKMKHV